MPPSSEQETQPIPVNRSSTPKEDRKQTPPGGSLPTKRGKKHGAAKDSGGTPAMTKPSPEIP